MVKLRLRRMGAKKRPIYRIVAAESREPRDGRFIETLGQYNPLTSPATVVLNTDRIARWFSVGAQPTETVARLLDNAGVALPPKSKAWLDLVRSRGVSPAAATAE